MRYTGQPWRLRVCAVRSAPHQALGGDGQKDEAGLCPREPQAGSGNTGATRVGAAIRKWPKPWRAGQNGEMLDPPRA